MSEVTCILSAIEQGDPHAAAHVLSLVYEELRKLAAQKLAEAQAGQVECARRKMRSASASNEVPMFTRDTLFHWSNS